MFLILSKSCEISLIVTLEANAEKPHYGIYTKGRREVGGGNLKETVTTSPRTVY